MSVYASATRVADRLPPNAFSFVMATGIVGTAFTTAGVPAVGYALLVIAAAALVGLVGALITRSVRQPSAVMADLRDPRRGFGFFTIPAAFGVLAALSVALGVPHTVMPALVLGGAVWLVLNYGMLPALFLGQSPGTPLSAGVDGSWFLGVVATQSCAILAALAGFDLLAAALWGVGIMLYILLAALTAARILTNRHDPVAPTAWIVTGATAISALAALRITHAGGIDLLTPFLLGASYALWAFGTWCIPHLLMLGLFRYLRRRDPLRYETALWSVVFPLGMYATTTYLLAEDLGSPALDAIAHIALVAAGIGWLTVCTLGVLSLRRAR